MPQRDQDKSPKRPLILQTRLSEDDAALIRAQADRAGISVSALIRYAVLNEPPLRNSRTPSLDCQRTGQILAALGAVASFLRDAAADPSAPTPHIEAAQRDLADMRAALFEALGKPP